MNIVILAAGKGQRFNKDNFKWNKIPKCLIEISNKNTILDINLKRLLKYRYVDEIFIVTGFKSILIEEHIKIKYQQFGNIKTIYNPLFDASVIYSIKQAFDNFKKTKDNSVLILNGDTVFGCSVFNKIDNILKENINTISIFGFLTEEFLLDDMMVNILENKLICVGKRIRKANGVSSGAILLCNKGLQKYHQTLNTEKNENLKTHHGILQVIRNSEYDIDFVNLKSRDWFEVDKKSDLRNQHRIVDLL